jgi:hypothetical protein
MQSNFFLVLFLILIRIVYSQTETIASFDSISYNGAKSTFKVFDDILLISLNQENGRKLYSVNLLTKEIKLIDKYIDYQVPPAKGLIYTNDGVFYQSYAKNPSGQVESDYSVIEYVNSNSQRITSEKFKRFYNSNQEIGSTSFTLFDNEYYFSFLENGKYCVKKFDGINSSIPTIFESMDPIYLLYSSNEKLVFAVKNDITSTFYALNTDAIITPIQTLNHLVEFIPTKSNFIYFNKKYSENSTKTLWRLNLSDYSLDSIIPNSFVYQIYVKDNILLMNDFTLRYDFGTNQLDSIFYSKNIKKNEFYTYFNHFPITKNSFTITSPELGFELGYIDENDSINLFLDFAKGGKSSFPYSINYSESINYLDFLVDLDTVQYQILTNGNDEFYYLYQIKDGDFKSLFKIENAKKVRNLNYSNGYFYWVENTNKKIHLNRRGINQLDLPQADNANSAKETWFQELALLDNDNFVQDYGYIKSENVVVDNEGNTFVGVIYSNLSQDVFLNLNNMFFQNKNRFENYLKYDKYGQLIWLKQVGAKDPYSSNRKIKVLQNGDLLVVGTFYELFNYEEVNLSTDFLELYAMVLDKNTGVVKKFNNLIELEYNNYLVIEQIELDEFDNLYISFFNRNKQLEIDNNEYTFDYEKSKKIVKFDNEFNFKWLKNTFNPNDNDYWATNSLKMTKNGIIQLLDGTQYKKIQYTDLQNDKVSNFQYYQSDYNSVNSIQILDESMLIAIGSFVDSIICDDFIGLNSSSQSNTYILKYDYQLGKVDNLLVSTNSKMFPLDSKKEGDNIYLLAGISEHNSYYDSLILFKLDKTGSVIAYKSINQLFYVSDLNVKFDLNNQFISIIGENFTDEYKNKILCLYPNANTTSVLRIKNDGWLINQTFFQEQNPTQNLAVNDVLIYPNPFLDKINLKVYTDKFTKYELIDYSGKLIRDGVISSNFNQQLDLEYLKKGLYLLKLRGENENHVAKIIKM